MYMYKHVTLDQSINYTTCDTAKSFKICLKFKYFQFCYNIVCPAQSKFGIKWFYVDKIVIYIFDKL